MSLFHGQEVLGVALATLLQMQDWTMSQIPRCLESSVRLLLCPPVFYVVFITFMFCIQLTRVYGYSK